MTSLQGSRSQTKQLSSSSVGNRRKDADGGCQPPAPASPGTRSILFRNPPAGWHCSRELSPFKTQGQAVPHHPVWAKEKREGGGNPSTTNPGFQQASSSCRLEGLDLQHREGDKKLLPCQGIVSDQRHTGGSLKTFPMLHLVN